jgi:hypothetical protein
MNQTIFLMFMKLGSFTINFPAKPYKKSHCIGLLKFWWQFLTNHNDIRAIYNHAEFNVSTHFRYLQVNKL